MVSIMIKRVPVSFQVKKVAIKVAMSLATHTLFSKFTQMFLIYSDDFSLTRFVVKNCHRFFKGVCEVN